MIGRFGLSLPSISSSSVWQTPQAEILIKTSFGPGIGTGNITCLKGSSSMGKILLKTIAFIFSPLSPFPFPSRFPF